MTLSLTGELHGKALLASEEVRGELQTDGVEGAVRVRRQRRAAQLPQWHPPILGPIPDAKHVMDLLGVENQEMQTSRRKDTLKTPLSIMQRSLRPQPQN